MARDRRQIWAGGILLAALAAVLTLLAVRYGVPFSGFAALLVTFLGLGWVSIRVLRGRYARFDRP
jgi:hypothetical protein